MRRLWERSMAPEEWNTFLRECQDAENPANARVARGRLYTLYCNRVNRYFLRRAHAEHLALDLMQQTFARVLARLNHFNGTQTQFESYLFTAARNVWLRQAVAGSIGKLVDLFLDVFVPHNTDEEQHPPDSAGAGNIPDSGKSPEERLIAQQMVRRALEAVTEPYRTPLILCDQEGYSYEEIARILNLPIGTVKSRIARGRTQFTAEYLRLTKQEDGEELIRQGGRR